MVVPVTGCIGRIGFIVHVCSLVLSLEIKDVLCYNQALTDLFVSGRSLLQKPFYCIHLTFNVVVAGYY